MTDSTETDDSAMTDYAARRRERAQTRVGDQRRKRVLLGVLAGIALLLVLTGVEYAFTAGRIHPGVTVAGVEVGGMKPDTAKAALGAGLAVRAAEPVVVTFEDRRWKITAEQTGLDFDHEAEVQEALTVGRRKGFGRAFIERIRCWFSGVDVAASPTVDSTKFDVALSAVATATDIEPIDARVEIDGASAQVIDGKDGRVLDRVATGEAVLRAFASTSKRQVEAEVVTAVRDIDAQKAEAAAKTAETMLSAGVTVTFAEKNWTFAPSEIAEWMAFRKVEATGGAMALEAFISPASASAPITKKLGAKIGRPAKNASFVTDNGRVNIVPSQTGIGPDIESLALSLTTVLQDLEHERVVELRTNTTEPEITTEKASAMGIKERFATYTTTYESGNRPRVNNIHTLGDALNGTLIEPGGVFSFNKAAGERTAAKGYQEANAIVNGKLVPQLGGGVCQVGTTVFNTVFVSGLPVIERKNHSFYISHYPAGRDATVSWGAPDLKFKNDTENWVLVAVSYTSGSITVALYGTDPGYKVESKQGPWSNIRPFKVEEVKDSTMYVGTETVEDNGVQGRTVTVQRIVSKDGKVLRTDNFVSNYKPKVEVIRVGTKPRGSKTTTKTP